MRRTKWSGHHVKPEVMESLFRLRTRANTKPWRVTLDFMAAMSAILEAHHPMTIRQLFYRLVSQQIIANNIKSYDKVSRDCGNARLQGRIPWDWIEDRVRVPTLWSMYDSAEDFLDKMADQYARQVWYNQPCYIEVAIEKDALSGIFSNVVMDYRVGLNVVRGFESLSASKELATRLDIWGETLQLLRKRAALIAGSDSPIAIPVHILYFGDFDPEGFEIQTALEAVLKHHHPSLDLSVKRCALSWDDITQYNLPTSLTKEGSRLSPKFIAEHGDLSDVSTYGTD